jgi:hypothetical protein
MNSSKLHRMMDRIALGELASAYAFFYQHLSDHRDAMSATCKWAIRSGYTPAACWVSTGMLAANRPTHTVALTKDSSPTYLMVLIGGVSIYHQLDVMYAPDDGVQAGWRRIEGAALERYRAWAATRAPDEIDYVAA